MNIKKRLETFVQGWLPKEPNVTMYHQPVSHKSWRTYRVISVVTLIIATFIGGLLGALAFFLNLTSGIGLYVWSTIIGITIGIVVGAILARMKQKEQQRTAKELKM